MKWEKFEAGYSVPVKSWCENCEEGAVKQAANLAKHPAVFNHVALMPDAHLGYGMPIGGVIACDNAVIPAAVGVDIGCGMVATETDVPAERFADMSFRRAFQEKLKERIPVGEGVSHREAQDWEGFEEYAANNGARANLWPSKLDRTNLGTLGGVDHADGRGVRPGDGRHRVRALAQVQGIRQGEGPLRPFRSAAGLQGHRGRDCFRARSRRTARPSRAVDELEGVAAHDPRPAGEAAVSFSREPRAAKHAHRDGPVLGRRRATICAVKRKGRRAWKNTAAIRDSPKN